MDDYFVTSRGTIFGGKGIFAIGHHARAQQYEEVRARIARAVADTPEEDVLAADPALWASGLAEDNRILPPRVDIGAAELRDCGPVQVDCTNAPGITFTLSEAGNVVRPGHRFQLSVPAAGDVELLRSPLPQGGLGELADVETDRVVRAWSWPDEKGSGALDAEIQEFTRVLSKGAEAIARDVEAFNGSLRAYALEAIEKRRKAILEHQQFLGNLSLPVLRDDRAPTAFGPPPVRRRETPARETGTKAPEAKAEPQLDEFYKHILDVIRAVGRGLERSPGSFRDADEEALRDHMLVTLNTHYVGATYAEAFNRSGKTDILIRVHDLNAFIGECKWWHGPKAAQDALDQLFGYMTWRDSRVALIFYVKAKEITPVLDKARAEFEGRDEFITWQSTAGEGELRFRVRWPQDENREATVTALFFHLG